MAERDGSRQTVLRSLDPDVPAWAVKFAATVSNSCRTHDWDSSIMGKQCVMATQVSKTTSPRPALNAEPLEDKVALITGAGRGIGKAIAATLARAGACSIVVARE